MAEPQADACAIGGGGYVELDRCQVYQAVDTKSSDDTDTLYIQV